MPKHIYKSNRENEEEEISLVELGIVEYQDKIYLISFIKGEYDSTEFETFHEAKTRAIAKLINLEYGEL